MSRRPTDEGPGLFDAVEAQPAPARPRAPAAAAAPAPQPEPEREREHASEADDEPDAPDEALDGALDDALVDALVDAPWRAAESAPQDARPSVPEPRVSARPAEPAILTVGQLTAAIAGSLTSLGRLRVEGEVSRVSKPRSGHVFFDLKEDGAKVACKIWRSQLQRACGFDLCEGQQVVVTGRLDVYAPHGSYSLVLDQVEQRGLGALLARLEALKRELKTLGWLDRARALPALPRTIGVVTSRDGAALRDVLRTRSLRWPLYPVRLAHAPVQGPGAAPEIAAAIEALDASGVDVILLTRGGGSLEDLWAFNERVVAEAIWNARVPVVSAVGHETDFTLADLVADRRAHTPTDGAQTVIPDRAALLERLERAGGYLVDAMDAHVAGRVERLERAARSRTLRDAGWLLGEREKTLQRERERLVRCGRRAIAGAAAELRAAHARLERQSPARRLERGLERLRRAGERLQGTAERRLDRAGERIRLAARGLEATSPLAVLARGYSIARRADGGPCIVRADDVALGATIETRLHDGSLVSRVTEVRPGDGDA